MKMKLNGIFFEEFENIFKYVIFKFFDLKTYKNLRLVSKYIKKLSCDSIKLFKCSYIINKCFNIEYNKKKVIKFFKEFLDIFGNIELDIRENYESPLSMIKNQHLTLFENIKYLDLRGNFKITDSTLSKMKDLIKLKLNCCSEITDEGLKYLKNLKSLYLFEYKKITKKGLNYLKNTLKILFLYGESNIKDGDLKGLDIRVLYLKENKNITNKGLNYLKNLEKLSLEKNNNITDDGINRLKNLKILYLPKNNKITNKGILPLKNIEKLDLSFNNIISFHSLKNKKNLKCLYLTKNKRIKFPEITKLNSLNYIGFDYSEKNYVSKKYFKEGICSKIIVEDLQKHTFVPPEIHPDSDEDPLENYSSNYDYDYLDDYYIKRKRRKTSISKVVYTRW